MQEMSALVKAVKDHALAHYNDGGWDVVVECWEDAEIERLLREGAATTSEEAIAAFAVLVDIWADRQADVKNSEF